MKKIVEIFKCAPTLNKVAYWVCLVLAAGLLISGFVLPPLGNIDNSVLIATGEIFAFASLGTLIVALDMGVDAKVSHKDTSIEINNPENPDSKGEEN